MKTLLRVDATLMTLKTNHCECIILSNKIWILQIFFDGLHQYFQSRKHIPFFIWNIVLAVL